MLKSNTLKNFNFYTFYIYTYTMGIIKFLFGKNTPPPQNPNPIPPSATEPSSVPSPAIPTPTDNKDYTEHESEVETDQVQSSSSSLISSANEVALNSSKNPTGSKNFWSRLFERGNINDGFFEELEEELISADLGAKIALQTVEEFRTLISKQKIKRADLAVVELKKLLLKLLPDPSIYFKPELTPVLCLVGVNGTGKTTTLAKLAHHYEKNYQVVLAAADTFRAAATLQLEEWAKKLNVQFVSKGSNSDAAAVAFDAVEATLAKTKANLTKKGLCLIDTAGRLENKVNLMEQLGKLIRIVERFEDKADLKKILVLDATLGRNGVDQARVFYEKIKLDGIILTKVDTQAKAGFLLTISQDLGLPIYFITYGEKIDMLAPFNRTEYIDTLLENIA